MPPKAYNATYNNINYYYYSGVFYQYNYLGYYYVVPAPIGFHVPRLPYGVSIFYYSGLPYYYYYDTYYMYDCGANVYVVVEKPEEADTDSDGNPDEVSANLPTPGYDRIVLVGGSSVEGVYLGGTPETVEMGVGSDTLRINLAEVVRIDFASSVVSASAEEE